jgi:hypothetical protein
MENRRVSVVMIREDGGDIEKIYFHSREENKEAKIVKETTRKCMVM